MPHLRTFLLLLGAVICATFKAGYRPDGWAGLQYRHRVGEVREFVAEVRSLPASFRSTSDSRLDADIRAFKGRLEAKVQEWQETNDVRWLPGMRTEFAELVRRGATAK